MDTTDNVAELRALDTPPFTIDYRRAALQVPTTVSTPSINIGMFQSIIDEVEAIELYITREEAYADASRSITNRRIAFGAAPSSPARSTSTADGGDSYGPAEAVGLPINFGQPGASTPPTLSPYRNRHQVNSADQV